MPLLRFRDGDEDGYFNAPITIVGHVIGVGDDVVTVELGRHHQTQLYVEDFYELLGGPESALGILVDAGAHRDLITIHLGHERLSYDNDHQLARLR